MTENRVELSYDTVQNGLLRLTPAVDFTFVGVLRDGPAAGNILSFDKLGLNSLTLTGANTYSGLTRILAGTLFTGATNTLSVNSQILINGSLDISGFDQSVKGFTGGGTITSTGGPATLTAINAAGVTNTFGGSIDEIPGNAIKLVKDGSGTQNLTKSSSFTGGTDVHDGILGFGTATSLGSGKITFTGASALVGVGALAIDLANQIQLDADGAISGKDVTLSGVISGTHVLDVSGGTVSITNTNTYNAGTLLTAGKLVVGSDAALGTGALTVADGSSFGIVGPSVTLGNDFVLDTLLHVTMPSLGNTLTLNGTISGVSALYIDASSGSGTLLLNGANTNSGTTQLGSGILGIGDNAALGTGALKVFAPATLQAFANLTVANAVRTNSALTIDTGIHDLTLSGTISDTTVADHGVIVKAGTGVLTLTQANNYSGGTTLAGGTLAVDGNAQLGAASAGLTFDGGNLRITGTGFTTTARALDVATTGGFDLEDAGTLFTVNSSIAGPGRLTVTGAGTLWLTAANTIGGVDVDGGTLVMGHSGALGTGDSLLRGTLFASLDNLEATNNIGLAGATVDVGSYHFTLSGVLSDKTGFSGTLDKFGSGILELSGTNTFTGGAFIHEGVVFVGANNALGTGAGGFDADTNLTARASISLASDEQITGNVIVDDGGFDLVLDGAVTGTGRIIKKGGGSVALNGSNTYSGGTQLEDGTLVVGSDTALGDATGGLEMFAGTVLKAGESVTLVNAVQIDGSGATIDTNGHDLALNGAVGGVSALLTKTGSGTLTLSALNTYGGGTALQAGKISFDNDEAFGTGTITVATGTLGALGARTLANDIIVDTSATVELNNYAVTLDGDISGAGTLTIVGGGDLTLNGTNSFGGGAVVSLAQVLVGTDSVFGANGVTFGSAVTLGNVSGALRALDNDFVLNGPAITLGGGTSNLFLSGDISGSFGFTKSAATTLTLSGSNSYAGNTLLDDGTIVIETGNALGTGTLVMNQATTLQLGTVPTTLTLANGVSVAGNSVERIGAGGVFVSNDAAGNYISTGSTLTLDGVLSGNAGGALVFEGYGRTTLNGVNTLSGDIVANGLLIAGNDDAFGTASVIFGLHGAIQNGAATALTIANNIVVVGGAGVNHFIGGGPGAKDLTLSGEISGTAGIDKVGIETLTLTGTNTYLGSTLVSAGTLVLGGPLVGGGAIHVAAGATLSGNSTTIGDVSINGGTLAAVSGAGQLTVDNLTFDATSHFAVSLGAPSAAQLVRANGDITISNGALLDVTGLTGFNVGSYLLIGYGDTRSGTFGIGLLPAGYGAANVAVDTSVANQISLMVNSGGILYWNGAGPAGSAVNGSSGDWTVASTNWTDSTGAATFAWGSATGIFTGTAGTVSVVDNLAFDVLYFKTDGYLLADGGGSLSGSVSGEIKTEGGVTTTIDAVLAGANGLRKTGDGKLILGGANTFAGGVTVERGTLEIANALALGAGVFNVGDQATIILDMGFDNDIVIAGSTPSGAKFVTGTGTAIVSGDISGTGSLTKSGAGDLELLGTNSYAGTFVNGGLVRAGNANAFGTGDIAVADGAGIGSLGSFVLANAVIITGAGSVDMAAGNALTLAGAVSGGKLVKTGSGELILTGANTYTGGTSIVDGILSIASDAQLGASGAISFDGVLATPVLNLTANFTSARAIALGNDAEIRSANASTNLLTGQITGNGLLLLTGSGGTITLANASNSYAGGTVVYDGATLSIGGDGNLGDATGRVQLGAAAMGGGTLLLTGDVTAARAFAIAADSIIGTGAFTLKIDGTLSGAGAITKTGAGTLALNHDNSGFSGGINLTAGTLSLLASNAAGTGTITTTGSVIDYADGVGNAAAIVVDSNMTQLRVTTGEATQSASISELNGPRPLEKIGAGTLVLSAANSFSGPFSISAGGIAIGTSASLGAGDVAMADTTRLRFDADALVVANNIDLTGFVTVQSNITSTLGGVLIGSGSLTKTGSGDLSLTGSNTYLGGTFLNAGSISITGDANLGGTAGDFTFQSAASTSLITSGDFTSNRDYVFTNAKGTLFTNTGSDIVWNGVVAGAGPLNKSGNGTLTLTNAANSFADLRIGDGAIFAGSDAVLGAGNIEFYDTSSGVLVFTDAVISNRTILLSANGTIDTQGNDVTLTNVISGAHTLGKSGAGILTLDAANSHNGGTKLSGGTLAVGNSSALGSGQLTFVNTGTTLQAVAAALTLGNAVALNGSDTVDTQAFDLALSGSITGGGSLTKIGSGALTLSNNSSYTGGTTIDAGTLQLGSSIAAGTGLINLANATTLRFGAAALHVGNDAELTGVVTVRPNGFFSTLGGTIGGAGTLLAAGPGTLVLGNAANSYSGGTQLDGGVRLEVSSDGNLGAATGSVAFANAGSGTLGLSGAVASGRAFVLTADGTVDTMTGNDIFTGLVSGAGLLIKTGATKLTLAGANTYTSGTLLTAGSIAIGTSTSLGSGTLTFGDGTTLQSDAAALDVANAVVTNGVDTVDTNSFNLTLGGLVSGTGSIKKIGAGALTFDHANTYSSGTDLVAGAITVTNNASLGSGKLSMADATRLNAGANGLVLINLIGTAGVATIDSGTGTFELAGVIDGAGSLTKADTGTLILSGVNSYAGGTALTAGAIRVTSNLSLGGGSLTTTGGTTLIAGGTTPVPGGSALALANAVVLGTGATTIDLRGTSSVINQQTGSYVSNGTNLTLSGTITGDGSLVTGNFGTLALTGTNRFTGGITATTANVLVTNDASLGTGTLSLIDSAGLRNNSGSAVTLANAVKLAAGNNSIGGASNLTLDGAITGATGFTKVGVDTLNLTGTSSYSGDTTVVAGTLKVNGALNGTGTVAIAAGATLGGSGSIAGLVTVADGGAIAPDNSSGTLTVGGLSLSNVSLLDFDLGQANKIGGAFNDRIIVTHDLTLDGLLSVTDSNAFGVGVYNLITYGGALTDRGLQVASLPGAFTGQIQTLLAAHQVNLIVTLPGVLLQYWDADDGVGNGIQSGGTGTWNTLNTNWTGEAPADLNTGWQGGVAVFGGTAGTVTIASPQAAQGLQFVTDGYTLDATGTGGLTMAGPTFFAVDANVGATISAPLSGAGSVLKQGGGTLTLLGANSYTGGTTITAGTLGAGTNTAFGTGAVAISNGATLQAAASVTLANAISTTGTGTIDAALFDIALTGLVSGNGSLLKGGGGTLTLDHANTYAGGTSLHAGTIVVTTDASLGTGTLAIANFANLTAGTSGLVLANAVSLDGNSFVDSGTGTFELHGNITGGGHLEKLDSGTLILSGNNAYTGGTTLTSGTIRTDTGTALGTSALFFTNGTTLQAGASVTLNNVIGTSGIDTVDTNGFDLTLPGFIDGAGSLRKTGAGTLILSGPNIYSGGTTLVTGAITVLHDTALGSNTLAMAGGTHLNAGVTGLTLDNAVSTAGVATIDSGAGVFTLNGSIGGAGSFTKVGAGTLTLTAGNTYAGGTLLTDGTIKVAANTSLGTGTLTFTGGTTLQAGAAVSLANAVTTAGIDTIDTNGLSLELTGLVGGSGSLDKIGNGNVFLTHANTYTGGTTLQAGGIIVRDSASLGTGTLAMASNTALRAGIAGLDVTNDIATAGAATIDAGTIGSNFVLRGKITGAGSLVKVSSGLLVLSGDNAYTGGTLLNAGGIAVTTDTALGTNTLTMAGGTLLTAGSSGLVLANSMLLNGPGLVSAGLGSFELHGPITGAGSLTTTASGMLILSGNNGYTGGTTLASGTIRADTTTALGTGRLTFSGGAVLQAGTSLALANTVTTNGIDTVDTNGFNLELTGIADGAGSLHKIGSGTLILSGNNSYAGGTTLVAGIIRADTSTALGLGRLTFSDATALRAGANLTLANAVTTTGVDTIDTAQFDVTLNGVIDGDGAIEKAGNGALTLNGANAYSGGTNLTSGTIVVGDSLALGTGRLLFEGGTTLKAGGTGFVLANTMTTSSVSIVDTQAFALTLAGAIDGAGQIDKTGSGKLTLNHTNIYTGGTVLQAGTIAVGTDRALGTGALIMLDSTTLQAGADGLSLANNIVSTGRETVDTQDSTLTLTGVVSGEGGSITKLGSGKLILNGASSYTGGTTVAAGTLIAGTDSALGTGTVTMLGGTTLQAGVNNLSLANTIFSDSTGTIDTQANTLTLSGSITEDFADSVVGGNIVKIGSGKLILTGASSYVGTTTLTEGTTLVDGSLGDTAVTVSSGATLGGGGSILGSVDVLDGGILAAGNSPGTLTLGSLTLHDASIVTADLGAPNTIGGTFNDLVKVTGNLTLDGLLDVADSGTFGLGIYELFSYGGTLTDNGLVIASLPATGGGIVQTLIPGQVNLVVNAPGVLTQYWDAADGLGNGVRSGGTGTWSSLGTDWTGETPSELNANWQGGAAIFAGTAGVVTIDTPQNFQSLQFAVDGYSVVATGTGGLVTNGAGIVAVATGATTNISAPISGTSGLVKQAGGTLNLTGDNSYAGGTDLQTGTLGVGSNTALGTGKLTIESGAKLAAIAAGLVVANTVTTAGAGTIDTAANVLTLTGTIDGAGSIVKIGTGTLVLNSVNTYAGGTALNAGQVTIGNSAALGTGTLALATGTRLTAGTTGLTVTNLVTTAGVGTIDSGTGLLTLSGKIAGAGSITKIGTGTLLLSGDNGFNGANVTLGTLAVGSNTAAGSGAIALAGGTTLQAATTGLVLANGVGLTGSTTVDSQALALTLGGVISGSGSLAKIGTGTLTLAAANTYAGGTALNAGTIAVGTGTSLGSGTLTINSGTLRSAAAGLVVANAVVVAGPATIDTQANTFTLSGTTSGPGTLAKIGTGTLVLAGASTRTGVTTITAGTLSGSVATLGLGNIVDNGALVFTQAVDGSYGPAISGTGSISKSGAGNLTLTGSSSVSGATSVTGGRLTVAGALTASTVTLGTGTTLAGTGSVAGLVATSGSTVSPGATDGIVGTLSVGGPAAFQAGSTLAINVTPTTADRLTIGGAASLAGNLMLTAAAGQYFFNTSYTLLSAASITGKLTPPALTLFGPAFAPTLTYGSSTLVLKLVPNSLVKLLGGVGSQNVLNVASAFDRATSAGFNPQAFYGLYLTGANLGASINQLTGEIHSADRRTAIADTRYVREAALDRLGAGFASGTNGGRDVVNSQASGDRLTSAWGRVVGSWTKTDSDGNGAKLDINAKGFITGVDSSANNLTFGALFNYIESDVDTRILGKSKVKSTGGGLYAGYRAEGGIAAAAGGSISGVKSTTNRTILVPGLTQSLKGKTDGTSYQAFGDVSYDLAAAANTRVEPFARLAYVEYHVGSLSEGGGFAGVNGKSAHYDATFVTLGLRASTLIGSSASLRGSVGYQRTSGDRTPVASLSIQGTGQFNDVRAVALDKSAFAGEAGVDFKIGKNAALGVGYSGVIGKNNSDNGVKATFSLGF